MKNKINIYKKIQVALFALFLVSGLFGFISFPQVSRAASCPFTITTTSDQYSVDYSGTFNITASVVGSGSTADCKSVSGGAVYFALFLKRTSAPIVFNLSNVLQNKQVPLNSSNAASATFSFSPKGYSSDPYFFTSLPTPNRLDFQVVAYASGGGISLQTSGLISVAVTGVPASNLGLNLNVAFTDNKGQYNEGDAVNIKVTSTSIDAGQKATAQGIQQIYFAVYVNDSNKAVAGYTYSGSTIQFFAGPQQYNNLQVSAANGFISGSNKIIVKLYQAGTSNEVAEGYAILQAQGSGLPTANTQTPPPSGSTPPVGGTTAVGGGTANPAANIDCTKNPDPNYCLYNPLPVDSLTSTVLLIMRGFLAIVGLWCVLFIVIGGFRFVMSQGNEEAVTAARKTITWAVIGFVICLLSFSIMAIVQYVLQVNVKNVSSATSMAPIVRIIKDL